MSIASAITNAQQKVANAYDAVDNKGGTLPATQDLSNLPTAINSIPTSSAPILDSLTITPTTSSQSIIPPSGVDGYDSITVNAVTSSIDSDIVASNIKSGVNILGVNGSVTELKGETRTVSITSTSGNTFTPSSGKNGITSIKCSPTNQARTVTPSTTSQSLTVNSGYSGNGTITVNAVTSSIDNNIQAGNIKSGVSILGVTGTYTGGGGSFVGIPREVDANGVYKPPSTNNFTWSLPSTAINLWSYVLYYAFYNCSKLTGVDLSSLTKILNKYALAYAFYGCTNLAGSLDLSDLATIEGTNAMDHAFYNCSNLTSVDLSGLTTVNASNAMYYAFYNCTGLTGALDLSSLTTLSGGSSSTTGAMAFCFQGCTKITSVDLSGLTSVVGYVLYCSFYTCTGITSVNLSSVTTVSGGYSLYQTFYGCTSLTTANLSNLTTVTGTSAMNGIFYGCTSLSSVDFSKLTTIGENTSTTNHSQFTQAFYNCNALTSITFSKLEKIYCTGGTTASYGTFANNNKVQKMYFPKLDTITYGSGASSTNQNACKNVFNGCSSLTELHFAAANQSAIQASPGYSTAWGRGAGNVTIYFDL